MTNIYSDDYMQKKIKEYSKSVVGPVMYRYTQWVLCEAKKRGIDKLYFLARDGYLLYQIATMLCKKYSHPIKCRYLYCSRQSLRMPSYHIIGNEAFDLLLLGGYYVTPRSVLERAMLTDEQINEICLNLAITDRDRPFKEFEFNEFKEALKDNETYKSGVLKNSKSAYEATIRYFKQEELFDSANVAIVDSGWTGSMQRSLRQLLESAGWSGKLTGFYFGMYVEPKDKNDGEYLNFYFNRHSGAKRKINFNNNLFECMLSANHSMTIGYEEKDGAVAPIFSNPISKLQKELGWEPSLQFEEGIERTVRWYLDNQEWMDNVTSGDYQSYYDNMYKDR